MRFGACVEHVFFKVHYDFITTSQNPLTMVYTMIY